MVNKQPSDFWFIKLFEANSGLLQNVYCLLSTVFEEYQIKLTISDSFLVFVDFVYASMIERKNLFGFYCVIFWICRVWFLKLHIWFPKFVLLISQMGCEFHLSKAKANDSCSKLSAGAQNESNAPINVFPQRGKGGNTAAIDIDVLPVSGTSEQLESLRFKDEDENNHEIWLPVFSKNAWNIYNTDD